MKKRLFLYWALVLLWIPVTVFPYSVDQGTIRDTSGQEIQLRGVNWFGFETADHVVHGLWARNWRDMIAQIKAVGFNAVRIPVCPGTLRGMALSSVNLSLNPDLQGKNSLQALDAVLAEFDRQGIHILLDHHRLDCHGGITELWYQPGYSEQAWIDDLAFMAHRYRHLPHFLGIDLKNEPHGAATWGLGQAATDWNKAAERAASAVLAAHPDLLIFVEGIQENAECSGTINHWWGGNLEPLACHPLAITPDRLVLAPHVYGPDVYQQPYFNAANFPQNMPAIWDAHFGRFRAMGHAIAIGEAGGRYGHGGDPRDKTWQDALIQYLGERNIPHLFYWSWNPNSGDTGGILKDDWTSVWQDKIDLLNRLWNGGPSAPACSDGLDNDGDLRIDYPQDPGCESPGDTDERDPSPPPAACKDGLDNDEDGLIDYPADKGCQSPGDNDEFNLTSAGLRVAKFTRADWGAGYCMDVRVGNATTRPVPWQVRIKIEGKVVNLWNAAHVQNLSVLQAWGLGWNQDVPARGEIWFGFCAQR